jgi:hypothetical protein
LYFKDVDGWNAQVEDDAKILPLLKRKWPCSNNELGDIQAVSKLIRVLLLQIIFF